MHNIVFPLSVLSIILSVSCLIALGIITAQKNREIAHLRLLVDFLHDYMREQADKFNNLFPCENEDQNCRFRDAMMGYPGVYKLFCKAKIALSRNKICPYTLQNSPERLREKCSSDGRKDSD